VEQPVENRGGQDFVAEDGSPLRYELVRRDQEAAALVPARDELNLAAAGLIGSDFDSIPFLMVNGDDRPLATRKGNYAAAAAMNASRTRKVGPALSPNVEDPIFNGTLNGHTHMGMLGSTALVEYPSRRRRRRYRQLTHAAAIGGESHRAIRPLFPRRAHVECRADCRGVVGRGSGIPETRREHRDPGVSAPPFGDGNTHVNPAGDVRKDAGE
jgi:hypothetical protein